MNSKMVRQTKFYNNYNGPYIMFHSTGIPVAWGIIDREDVPTLEAFFKCIQEKAPLATVNTFMTDDGIHFDL